MKIELELDERELATNITIERIIKEVIRRLDEKLGTMVMETVDEVFEEKVDDFFEEEDTFEDLVPDWEGNPLLEEVTVVSSEGVKTCTKLEALFDNKVEDAVDKAVDRTARNVMRQVRELYGEAPRNSKSSEIHGEPVQEGKLELSKLDSETLARVKAAYPLQHLTIKEAEDIVDEAPKGWDLEPDETKK